MQKQETDTFYPTSKQAWREWLQENHHLKQSVWLVQHRKKSGKPSISWSEAVDEALCFGWIDSIRKTKDDETFIQFFSKRKANSTWSKVNKEKVGKFIADGRMTPAGLKSIETAKQNGSWSILDEAEELIIPKDLESELKKRPGSKEFFLGLSKSVKKSILQWVALAKRPETRQKRITEIATLASQKLKPKQF